MENELIATVAEDGKNRWPDDVLNAEVEEEWLKIVSKAKDFSINYGLYGALMENMKNNGSYLVALAVNTLRKKWVGKILDKWVEPSYRYLVFKSFGAFKEFYYGDLQERSRHFFEVIKLDIRDPNHQRVGSDPMNRLFFDLDLKDKLYSDHEYLHPEALQDLEEIITATIKECYPEKEIPPLDFVWAESCRKDKLSYHLVVKGLLFHECYDHLPMIYWAVCYNVMNSPKFSYVKKDYFLKGEFLDKAMLKNTLFRMVGSTKLDPGSVPLRLINSKYKLEDSLVRVHCVIHPDDEEFGWRKDVVLMRGDFKFKMQEQMEIVFGLKQTSNGEYYIEGETTHDDLKAAFDLCQKTVEWFRIFDISNYFNSVLYLKNRNQAPFDCPCCQAKRHKKSPCHISVLGEDGNIIFKCRLSGGKKISQLRESKKQPVKKKASVKKGKKKDQDVVAQLKEISHQKLVNSIQGVKRDGLTPLDIFERITEWEDIGGADAFCALARDSFFVVMDSEKYIIYGWREEKRLWEKIPVREFLTVISKVIVEFLQNMRDEFCKLKLATPQSDKELILKYDNAIGKATEYIRIYRKKYVLETIHILATGQLINDKLFMLLDSYPYLLSVAEGEVVDLRDGKVRKREKTDYLTYESPTKYTGKVSPIFEKFINDIFLDNAIMVEFMRKALGYSITGYTEEHKMFIMRGDTRNGKSALLKLIKLTLGKGIFITGNNSVIEDLANDGKPTNSLFRIKDARIVNLPETESNAKMVESAIKRMTGADSITCRANFQGEIEFDPAFKIWIATNYNPDTSLSDAILERFVFIEFPCRFTDKPKLPNERLMDRRLDEKFATEEFRESCLSWLVSGGVDYCRNRELTYPKIIYDNKEAYVKEKREDIDSFLEEKYLMTLPRDFFLPQLEDEEFRNKLPSVQFTNLYNEYKNFSIKNGFAAKDKKYFGHYLKDTRVPIIPWKKIRGDKVIFYGLQRKGAMLI